jgi:hypothetical protein
MIESSHGRDDEVANQQEGTVPARSVRLGRVPAANQQSAFAAGEEKQRGCRWPKSDLGRIFTDFSHGGDDNP